jgi:hypothetical protein
MQREQETQAALDDIEVKNLELQAQKETLQHVSFYHREYSFDKQNTRHLPPSPGPMLALLDSHITAVCVSPKQHWIGGRGGYTREFEALVNMTFDPRLFQGFCQDW